MERQNTVKSKSVKLILIILAVVFVLSAITVPVVVTTTRNDATATTQSADNSIGNLYNTDGTLNNTNVKKFLGKLGAKNLVSTKPTLTSPQIALRAGTSGSFVFEMGYYVSTSGAITTTKPIKWQAVYSNNGYLTIWMANNYTTDVFNDYGDSGSGWGSSTKYERLSNYSKSTLRDCANGIYDMLSKKFSYFNSIIVSPSEANATWQATQSDLNFATDNDKTINYYIHHSGLKSYSGSYSGWSNSNWDTANPPYNDEFWIPSWNEVYRNTSDTSKTFPSMPALDGGIWRLSAQDLQVASTALDGKSSNSFWLRSGNSNSSTNATAISGSSAIGYSWVYHTYGVRPACHVDLLELGELSGYLTNITASLSNADTNKATLDKTSGAFIENSGAQITFTYAGKTNYYINTIKINGNNITISETAPASFSSTTGTQYKCYRSANKVIVIVTNLTQNTTIVGTYATLWTISSLDSTLVLQSNTTQTQDNYFDTNATIVATFTENQNVQFCIDNVWTKLQGNMGFGSVTIASGTFNYAFNIYNNFITIELTNLPKISHIAYIDYYVGPSKNITASFSGGSGSVEMYKDDSDWYNLVAMPSSTFWVDSITFNNVSVDIEYYQIEIYGVGGAESVSYTVKDSTNVFLLKFKNIYQDIAVTFNLANVKQDYKVPPTTSGGASVTGTVVTASVGGEARIVGNDIASGSDTDTVTVMAVAYSGYKFVGWVNSNDESEILSDSTSYKLSKSEANGKIIKALFVPTTTNSNTNGQTSDDLSGLV